MDKSIHNPLAKEMWYGRKSIKSKRNVSGTAQHCTFFPYMTVYKDQDIKQQPRIPNNKTSPCEYGLDIYYC